jgi:hypothetical protein
MANTVPVTGTITINGVAVPFTGSIPAPANGVNGTNGVSPTPASVASALAATPSFVAAVAADIGTPVTPPVTTPSTSSWDGVIVDANGNLSPFWGGSPTPSGALSGGGNWDPAGLVITQGATSPDGSKALGFTSLPGTQWPLWIPFPAAFTGYPSPNGVAVNLAGYTAIELDIWPVTTGSFGLDVSTCSVEGLGSFVGANAVTNDTRLLTARITAPANQWSTQTVLLSALGVPVSGNTAPMWIYKMITQQQVPSAGVPYFIRNMKFL